jgi:hypothetical protein
VSTEIDPRILDLCSKVTAKRARAVIDHILKHGGVSTDELQDLGYTHPPRAARDVREQGIPLETYKVRSEKTGRIIGAYRFADPSEIKGGRIGGRRAFSKAFKDSLIDRYGSCDTITGERMDARYLQIDHRVPYEVAGDAAGTDLNIEHYMLLDASNQRAKSWSCEHCKNWQTIHNPAICGDCYWAFPETYQHVAMQDERRVDVVWQGEETRQYDAADKAAEAEGLTPAQFIKRIVKQALGE